MSDVQQKNVNFGVKVKLWRKFENCRRVAPFLIETTAGAGTETIEDYTELRNVTEIHYNHGRRSGISIVNVAFESDIHLTGMTCDVQHLVEFETELETEKASGF